VRHNANRECVPSPTKVVDLPIGWHNNLWQKCHDWLFKGSRRGLITPLGRP
jgi:hypothetical protein